MKNFYAALIALTVPLLAQAQALPKEVLVLRQNLQQGGFWLAQVPATTRVRLGGAAVPLISSSKPDKAYVLIGFDRFAPSSRWLTLCATPDEASCTTHKLSIQQRTYDTQNVKGAPKATLKPDAKAEARMVADGRAIAAARAAAGAKASQLQAFTHAFVQPILDLNITGVYGSRRLFEGEERSWHKGTDYAAPTGTPILAPAAGVVRLARDTFMSGNLVMLDHGGGLTSLYAHMHTMAVKVGQQVKPGAELGTVGTTGRSSGPHLHWGMSVGAVAIDPALWLKTPVASAP